MIPALVVFAYLGLVLYIGIFAFRRSSGSGAEDYFLAGRSLGPAVFLLSLFGTNMTAFTILGSAGHAFSNGIVTYGLMASSSALIIPLTLFLIGTRIWALGKAHGFMTQVQMFRDRWECGHIGTAIFALQAALLLPYIVIAVMGGGTTLSAVSGGLIPYWFGGAVVAVVVMSYVFFGGMRGTAWVNTLQTVLFLAFGAVAVTLIGASIGGFSGAMDSLLESPSTAALLTRERIAPRFFFSYMFIPLSTIAFPHISIFCLTARRMGQFKKTIIFYPLCILAIWLPCVFLGVAANAMHDVPRIEEKLEARAMLAGEAGQEVTVAPEQAAALRQTAAGDDVILLMLGYYAPLWLAGLLGAGIMAAVMASDSQILALSTMFTRDVLRLLRREGALRRGGTGSDRPAVCHHPCRDRVRDRVAGAQRHLRARGAVRVFRVRVAVSVARSRALLERQHQVGRARRHRVDGRGGPRRRRAPGRRPRPAARQSRLRVVRRRGGRRPREPQAERPCSASCRSCP